MIAGDNMSPGLPQPPNDAGLVKSVFHKVLSLMTGSFCQQHLTDQPEKRGIRYAGARSAPASKRASPEVNNGLDGRHPVGAGPRRHRRQDDLHAVGQH